MHGRMVTSIYYDIMQFLLQVPVEVDEARLLIEFRRFSTVSRSAEEVTDRTLRRIARKSLGMKPSKQVTTKVMLYLHLVFNKER